MKKVYKVLLLIGVMLGGLLLMAEAQIQYRVIPEKCIGCQICVRQCPVQAISMVQGKAVIKQEDCIKCGLCARKCPVQAIIVDTLQVAEADTTGDFETVIKPEPETKPEPKPELEPEIIESMPQVPATSSVTPTTAPSVFAANTNRCIGCEVCVHECPVQAITMNAGKAVIDSKTCISCGICERSCSFVAIAHTP